MVVQPTSVCLPWSQVCIHNLEQAMGCAQRRCAQLLGYLQMKDKLLAMKLSFPFSADCNAEATVNSDVTIQARTMH